MDTKTTISITEARKKLFDIAEEVQKPSKHYMLTEKGRPKAVIMSAEEYESWVETMEVIRIFPDLEKDIAETDEAVRTGEYKKWATLDDLKNKWNIVDKVREKPKIKYSVPTSHKTKGKKKSR